MFRLLVGRSYAVVSRKLQHRCTLSLFKTSSTDQVNCLSTFHLKQNSNFDWGHHAQLNQRLESVPYQDLLTSGVERIRRCLVHEEEQPLKDVVDWCSKVFDYNVRGGKQIRAVALLKAYCAYAFAMDDDSWNSFDSQGWQSAVTLAWCVETLQAYFLVSDDIMDQSVLRRGKPCWYKQADVGLCALNDAMLLNCGIYKVLEKNLGQLISYNNILHEFLKVTRNTVYGQCLDMLSHPLNKEPQFSKFTFEQYKTLVEYKTSNYTFCLPVHLAMHLVGKCTQEEFNLTRDICLKLGLYFQSQDDFLDCFGNPEMTGKLGNDIREGKLTWLAAKFLEDSTPEDAKEFMNNYGAGNKESVSQVMNLYKKSSVLAKFECFEEELYSQIRLLIESITGVKAGLFYNLFSQIQKRKK